MNIDWALTVATVALAGILATGTVYGWRRFDRWAGRRVRTEVDAATEAVEREATDWLDQAQPAPVLGGIVASPSCGIPTFGTERCGLLAGHADERHLSWPSGQPYPPDEHDTEAERRREVEPIFEWSPPAVDEVLDVDPPVVPTARLDQINEVVGAGWVIRNGVAVHRACDQDLQREQYARICAHCRPHLVGSAAGLNAGGAS